MLAGIPNPVDIGGTVDMMTGEFSFVATILQRAPALEAMGIDALPESDRRRGT